MQNHYLWIVINEPIKTLGKQKNLDNFAEILKQKVFNDNFAETLVRRCKSSSSIIQLFYYFTSQAQNSFSQESFFLKTSKTCYNLVGGYSLDLDAANRHL